MPSCRQAGSPRRHAVACTRSTGPSVPVDGRSSSRSWRRAWAIKDDPLAYGNRPNTPTAFTDQIGCHAHGFAWAWESLACPRKAVGMAPNLAPRLRIAPPSADEPHHGRRRNHQRGGAGHPPANAAAAGLVARHAASDLFGADTELTEPRVHGGPRAAGVGEDSNRSNRAVGERDPARFGADPPSFHQRRGKPPLPSPVVTPSGRPSPATCIGSFRT